MPSRVAAHRSVLIERERELDTLTAVLTQARTGEGTVAVIDGPAGIGKSRLLDAAVSEAAGFTVRAARGTELERGFSYGVVLQLLAPLVRDAGPELLVGPAALARPLFEQGAPPVSLAGDLPLLHGLHWLCATLAERHPLVLAIDDLQWVDPPSLRFLTYLGSRVPESAILVLGTLRSGEPQAGGVLLDELCALPGIELISPAPLSQSAVAGIAQRRFGVPLPPGFSEQCQRQTGGNPLFVDQLLQELELRGGALDAGRLTRLAPNAIVRLIERRLRSHPASVRTAAQALAVLGEQAQVSELAAMTQLPMPEVLAALDVLAAAELTAPGEPTAFRHPLLRQAALHSMPAGARVGLHLAAADALRSSDQRRAAQHLLATEGAHGSPPWAVEVLLAAANDARARGGGDEAIAYALAALKTEPPDALRRTVLLEVGSVQAELRRPEALVNLAAAAELADEPMVHAEIVLRRADALFHFACLDESAAVCRDAIAKLPTAGPDARELRLALEAAALSADALQGVFRERPAELAQEVAVIRTPAERAVAAHVLADQAARGDVPAAEVARRGREIYGDGILLREAGPAAPVTVYAGTAIAWAGDHATVLALTEEGLRLGHQQGSLIAITYAHALRAGTQLLRGELTRAESDAAFVVNDLPVADPMAFAISLAWLIEVLVQRGRLVEARDALTRSGLTGELPDLGTIDFLLLARGSLAAAEGNLELAAAEYEEVGRRATRSSYFNPAAMDWRSRLALVRLEQGDRGEARRLVDDEFARAERFGAPRAIGVAITRRAAVEEDAAQASEQLASAVELLAGADAALEHARALIELGSARHRAAQPSAREAIADGMDRAHRLGASQLVDRALQELRATGARPRRPRVRGSDALTPQELRVARLAGDGASNPEIAEALFLTRRTVEMHLSNAYRKLGIGARGALSAALDGS